MSTAIFLDGAKDAESRSMDWSQGDRPRSFDPIRMKATSQGNDNAPVPSILAKACRSWLRTENRSPGSPRNNVLILTVCSVVVRMARLLSTAPGRWSTCNHAVKRPRYPNRLESNYMKDRRAR
jgi:hypothetical protein